MSRSPMTFPPRDAWLAPGQEPSLAEMLADPLVHLVMRRDGVSRAELEAAIAAARRHDRNARCCRCAA
jgi:hypothetical protein